MAAPAPTARSWAWLGMLPFTLFALMFLLVPTMFIVVGAFRAEGGGFTLDHVMNLFTPSILAAFSISIRISLASAFLGCVIGFAVACSITVGGLPGWIRGPLLTFSGVASKAPRASRLRVMSARRSSMSMRIALSPARR